MLLVFFYALNTDSLFVQNDELEKVDTQFCNPQGGYIFFADSTCFLKLYATSGQIACDFSRFYVVLKKVSSKKCNPRGVTDKIEIFW